MVTDPRYGATTQAGVSSAEVDAGLRAYMLRVYNYMAGGVALTGIVAYAISAMAVASFEPLQLTELGYTLYASPLKWVVMLAPLGIAFYFGFRIHKMSLSTAQAMFWLFAGLMGASLSSIFIAYTGESVVRVFFISAASFAALSLYGYTTKRDLSPIGSFLIMGLFGIIIASIVNIFLASSALQFAISVIGVLVFAGLTAYDTQKIKEMYYQYARVDGSTAGKIAISGALTLYLDFINLFVFLLQLLGDRR